MQWLYSSCYACGLVLYLAVQHYYKNEIRNSALDGSNCVCGNCSSRGKSPPKKIADEATTTRNVLLMSSRRPPVRVSHDLIYCKDQRHICERPQRSCGQY